jgi:hypothetical protein
MGIVGLTCAYWCRRAAWADKALRCLAVGLTASTLALHGLTSWVLSEDPHRNIGHVPLPAPFASIAETLLLVLLLPGLFWQGALLAALVRTSGTGHAAFWKGLSLTGIAYSLWVLPWALGIIAD